MSVINKWSSIKNKIVKVQALISLMDLLRGDLKALKVNVIVNIVE